MRITPLDLRNHRFPRRWTGYSCEEVDEFLQLVSEDYEAVLAQLEQKHGDLLRLQARIEQLSANEQILQDTLTTAQKLAEDLKRTAIKEAEVIVGEAELQGEKVLDAAHRRAATLAEDIREMKALKTQLASAVRTTIETHLGLLEGLAADPPNDPILEGKVAYLNRSTKNVKAGQGSAG